MSNEAPKPGHFSSLGAAPNPETLTTLEAVTSAQAYRGDKGRRLYEVDPKFRHGVEAARFRVAKGETAQQQAEAVGAAKLQEFDRDMQAKGLQRTDQPAQQAEQQVDTRALEFLQNWRRSNPNATSEQLAMYERDLATIYAGRKFGESVTAFQERMRGDMQNVAGVEIPASAELDDVQSFEKLAHAAAAEGVSNDVLSEVLQAVAKVADEPAAEKWSEESFALFGYEINPAVIAEGYAIDMQHPQLITACREAQRRGISQRQFDALLRSYFAD
jgi:hypothetical protein